MNLTQQRFIQNNAGYSIVSAKPHFLYVSRQKGIAPIMDMLKKDRTFFKDCVIVDAVIGKAAAMMLVYGDAAYIHGRIMSASAIAFLNTQNIAYSFDECCSYIINRTKDGMCPMEQAVLSINDLDQAYQALTLKQMQLRK